MQLFMRSRGRTGLTIAAALGLVVFVTTPSIAACEKPSPPDCVYKKGKFGGQFEFLDCKSFFDTYIKKVNGYAACLQKDAKVIEAAFQNEVKGLESEFQTRMTAIREKYQARGAPYDAKFKALKRETDAATKALKSRIAKRSNAPLN